MLSFNHCRPLRLTAAPLIFDHSSVEVSQYFLNFPVCFAFAESTLDGNHGNLYDHTFVLVNNPLLTGDIILNELTQLIPNYMVPFTCLVIDDMLKTATAKIDRVTLKESVK